MNTQKEIATYLDTCAAIAPSGKEATSKQCWKLAGLILAREETRITFAMLYQASRYDPLTKWQASDFIKELSTIEYYVVADNESEGESKKMKGAFDSLEKAITCAKAAAKEEVLNKMYKASRWLVIDGAWDVKFEVPAS